VISDFAKYGVAISDFKILSISPPDSVQEMIDKRSSIAALGSMDQFMRFQAAQALENASRGGAASGEEGAGSGLMAAGVGIGAGLGMGGGLAGMVSSAFQSTGESCSSCHANLAADARFCQGCGQPRATASSCSSCRAQLPNGASFCPGCGQQQGGSSCPECQAPSPAGARFCTACGHSLS
jgi:membrane protease subunit (stomatin/prohibitin family)